MNWINWFNLCLLVLILMPNILFAGRIKTQQNKSIHKIILLLEQIGRYGSMFFMVVPAGINKLGFSSNEKFAFWLIGTVVLVLLYWLFWGIYLKKNKLLPAMFLAIIPCMLFLFAGALQGNWFVLLTGSIFGAAHSYITYQNNKSS